VRIIHKEDDRNNHEETESSEELDTSHGNANWIFAHDFSFLGPVFSICLD